MHRLIALDATGGAWFVDALRRAWDDGDAVLPVDPRLPTPARTALLRSMRPSVWRDASHDGVALDDGEPVEPGDALVVATSGTSGEPKGAVLTVDAIAASAHATSARLAVTADDVWLACLPLAHVGGLSVITRALHSGTGLIVHAGFDTDAVRASGATLVSLVSTLVDRVDSSSFRAIVLGGGRPLKDRPTNAVTTYGMTETGSGVVYDGVPLDGVEIRIDDVGSISLRCPMLARSYRLGAPLSDDDGWFDTGDSGRWLDDGRLHVDGRRGDVIVTGGEKVWPDAVEAVLSVFGDVCVAGLPDDVWGETVTAFVPVVSSDGVTLDRLRDEVKRVLPAYCAPRRLVVVEALPRTALGKIQRRRLVRDHSA